jgi:hypothetical protein
MEARETLVHNDQHMEHAGLIYFVRFPDMKVFRLGPRGAGTPTSELQARRILRHGRPISDAEATVLALAEPTEAKARRSLLSEAWERIPHRNAIVAIGGMFLVALSLSMLLDSDMGVFAETLLLIAVMPVLVFSVVFVLVAAAVSYLAFLRLLQWFYGRMAHER